MWIIMITVDRVGDDGEIDGGPMAAIEVTNS